VASLPAAASDRHVDDAFEGPAVVGPGAADAGPRRQQGLNELPPLIAQLPESFIPLVQGRVYCQAGFETSLVCTEARQGAGGGEADADL